MKVFLASDHAGFVYKQDILKDLQHEGYDVVDMGPLSMNGDDDYPDLIAPLAQRVAMEEKSFGIIIGGSGQGEAIVANRMSGVRAVVYATENTKIITTARDHNDANILSIGARFVSLDAAKEATHLFIQTPFFGAERHARRIQKIDGEYKVYKKIIPAILAYDQETVISQERRLASAFPFFQLDITDGIFAGKKSWPFTEPSFKQDKEVEDIFTSFKADFEIDLMVEYPERFLPFFLRTPSQKIIFHLGSTEKIKECCVKTKRKGKKAFIALHIGDNPESLRGCIEYIDGIQCMGISPVGAQGQDLDQRVYALIHSVKETFPNIPIVIDGGVKLWNIRSLFLQGVDRVVVGSGIAKGDIESHKVAFQRCIQFSSK